MGKVMSRINKQWYRFNAENRAHRVISQEKPSVAPKHPSSLKGIEEVLSDPSYDKEKAMMKDPVLDGYLKKVYVTSKDPINKKFQKPSEKARLPIDRSTLQETELGYIEPITVPKGKVTLKQLMKLLIDHRENPEVYNVARIAAEYRISQESAKDILEYLNVFNIHMKEAAAPVLSPTKKVLKYFKPQTSKALDEK